MARYDDTFVDRFLEPWNRHDVDGALALIGNRALPNGGVGWPCRTLRGLRVPANLLQLLPLPALPKAPETRRAAGQWLAHRQAELLPVPYFHVVFTLPGPIADIANQNKAIIYDLLLKVAAETLITIAADPKHLGARIGLTAVLHTWGSGLAHHPHAHIIVPGGGLSPDGRHWIACRPGFFLSVRVLSRLFGRLFLERLTTAYQAGRLQFFADQAALAEPAAFKAQLVTLQKIEWVVYAKRPFGEDPTRCSPTCPATPIGSLSPTAGSSPSTASA